MNVRPKLEQYPGNRDMTLASGADKGRIFIPRFGVGIGSIVEQQTNEAQVSSQDSQDQRSLSALVVAVYIIAPSKERADLVKVAQLSCME